MPSRAPGSARTKGGMLTSGPHGTVREGGGGKVPTGGPYHAAREGGAQREGEAERATPLGHTLAAAAGVWGWVVGLPTAQGQGASAWENWARVWAVPDSV